MFDPSKFTDVIYEVRDRAAWIIINRPEGLQRLPRPDAGRADPGIPARRATTASLEHRADRRRRQGVLHRRRPDPRMRDSMTAAASSACRSTSCRADPRRAQAGDRARQRLCDRRRQRAGNAVRPDDRRRHRAIRPGRPEGRLGRRGLGHGLAGASCRRQEGARNLVPQRPLHRRSRRARWASSTRSCRPPSSMPRSRTGPTSSRSDRRPRSRSPSAPSTPTATTSAASATSPCMRVKLFYDTAESKEGVAAFNEKRTPDFHKFT